MDLHTYMHSLSDDARAKFAEACGTTQNYLWNVARAFEKEPPKRKRPSARMAALIETNSNQMVRRWESNPETWHITWPELVGAEGAPSIPCGAGAGSEVAR